MTPAWDIQEEGEFKLAASTLLHACYATRANSADPYRSFGASGRLEFNIPSLGRLPHVQELFHRIHIVGRATHVYLASSVTLGPTSSPNNKALDDETVLVQKLEAPVPGRQIATLPAPYGQSTRTLRSATKAANQAAQQAAQPAALQQAQQTAQQSSPATQQSAVSSASAALSPTLSGNALVGWKALCHTPQTSPRRLDEKYVVKEAWVLYDRLRVEVDVLSAVDGAYACPTLAGYTTVPHPEMKNLAFFGSAVPSSSKEWRCRDWSDVYSSPETGPYFAPRVHRLIYYTTHGIQLESIAEDGFAFAHAVKDGLIALYILFWHKYLHRDVSTGNILALSSPTYHAEREIKAMNWYKSDPRFAKYMELLKKQCAFVSDFDQAVKWNEDRKHVSARSGTLACLSTKRLYAWSTGASAVDTLIDDLEAIIWTFLFVLLKYHSERNGLSELEAEHFEALKGDNLYHMLGTKHLILNLDDDAADDHNALKPTWPLWLRLFAAARIARSKLKEVVNLAQGVAYSEMTLELKQRYERTCVDAVFLYLDAVKDAVADQAFNRQPQPQPVDTVHDDKDVFGSTS
ncbi:hypothetical protein EXIGLDRAFT_732758 [Exidia glandulosa HHB12029]|uniref:Fungal-type protein kinase domain-containing protein n=1 Tax=Exidia glandulosa HHB12029 TaxID=1314781 RepID=A0A165Z930_EXIGL|nr:hypothetical protein EXIGLDRAFT_732758 [Exidia glandulosa HHB12029]